MYHRAVVLVRPTRQLSAGEVHVWWVTDRAAGPEVCSPQELAQAHRLLRTEDRQRFIARRSAVRLILAGYTSTIPEALMFDRTCRWCGDRRHGRPRLEGQTDLSFSTSSRPGRVVVAIAGPEMSVGVDIEPVDSRGADAVAEVALTAGERTATADGSAASRLRLWCRKEAVLKAMGLGLAERLPSDLDVRCDQAAGYHITDVRSPSGWVAAVATSGQIGRLLVSTNESFADRDES